MVSIVDFPLLAFIPVGIPRPLSRTDTTFPGSIVTWISVQNPANASSIELSTISQTKWCNPLDDVVPMYIPGLFLTASSPSSTCISLSS